MFALIERGVVAALNTTQQTMHPAMEWIEVGADASLAVGWLYDAAAGSFTPPSKTQNLEALCAQIDAAADTARRAVAGDPLRAVEYEKSAIEAQAFKSAGYPAEAVPRTVAAWAIGGRTAQQAADSILAEAMAFNDALYLLRETRLQAKHLVRQAMTAGNVDLAQDIAFETIASIEAAIAGIGNAKEQA